MLFGVCNYTCFFFFQSKNIAEHHLMIGDMKQCHGYLLLLITSNIYDNNTMQYVYGTAHFCVHPYNICGEACAHLYGKNQSF